MKERKYYNISINLSKDDYDAYMSLSEEQSNELREMIRKLIQNVCEVNDESKVIKWLEEMSNENEHN